MIFQSTRENSQNLCLASPTYPVPHTQTYNPQYKHSGSETFNLRTTVRYRLPDFCELPRRLVLLHTWLCFVFIVVFANTLYAPATTLL